jgi:ribonuclease III
MKSLEKLKIQTNQPELYETAFTHTSYANEMNTESYERLEYLGDAVLELFVSNYLYHKKDMEEGEMTKKRSHLVCENALFEYSMRLGLNEDLRLGKGELENGGMYRKAIVADIFESFLGALYLDKGYPEVAHFMETYIVPIMEDQSLDFFDDYKSILQEQVQTDKRSLQYIVTKETGPAHNKTFTVAVKIDDIVYGEGTAHSKKEAENLAAKDALSKSVTK